MASTGKHTACLLFLVGCLFNAITVNTMQYDSVPRSSDNLPRHPQNSRHQQPPPPLPPQEDSSSNSLPTLTTPRMETPPPPPPLPRHHHRDDDDDDEDDHMLIDPRASPGGLERREEDSRNNNNDNVSRGGDPDSSRRRRRKRCKCVKRFMKEVDQLIDERLELFENKYLRQVNMEKERALALQNEASSTASRIQGLDKMMLALSSDVVQTKETLSLLSTNLEVLRYEMNHTRGDVRYLNESFKQLDGTVDTLNRLVSRVERMIPAGLSSRPGLGGVGAEVEDDPKQSYPRNCDEVYRQGGMQFQGDYYIMIKPDGVSRPFKVLCKIFNNSGWTVIQKRQDGAVDFFRSWQEYRKGFGSLEGEFWLGNDYIHHLSVQEPTTLRIELTDWEDRTYFAEYDSFRIDNEKGLYRLHIGNYHGDAGDSLRSHWENHDGMPFSTKDRDNDGRYYDSCAEHFHGAWWFNNCFDSHLNGKYYHKGFHKNYFQRDGIQWNTIHMYSSLKSVYMMMKPTHPAAAAAAAAGAQSADLKRSGKRDKRRKGQGKKGRRSSRNRRKE